MVLNGLARWAAKRPHVLLAVAPQATRVRQAVEAEVARMGGVAAVSPADADVLLVVGSPGDELAGAIDEVWRQMPGPRAQVQVVEPGEAAGVLGRALSELPLGHERAERGDEWTGSDGEPRAGRQIPASTTGGRPLVDLVQTDAAISPGNSGGALIDAQGRLVGLNEAYIPPSAGAVSLGFAIPSSTVVDVADQLLASGSVAHPFLGVSLTTLTPEIASALGVKVKGGALVREVQPGSPAATAGVRAGDVIVRFNETAIATVGDVYGALRNVKPGDSATLGLNRGGTTTDVKVTLGTLSR